MNKKEIRRMALEQRRKLTDAEVMSLSQNLADRLFLMIPMMEVKLVHTFLPIERNREPDTWQIIHRLKRDFPWIEIAVPRMNADGSMDHFILENLADLLPNALGIPEVQSGRQIRPELIDLVLVPLLAFDLRGHRVGYGKGYYDRFLAQCRNSCRRVGLSLLDPVEAILDSELTDEMLDWCITPSGIYTFERS